MFWPTFHFLNGSLLFLLAWQARASSIKARLLMSELLHSTFGSKKANGLQSPFGPAPLLPPRGREKSALTAVTSTAFGALLDGWGKRLQRISLRPLKSRDSQRRKYLSNKLDRVWPLAENDGFILFVRMDFWSSYYYARNPHTPTP